MEQKLQKVNTTVSETQLKKQNDLTQKIAHNLTPVERTIIEASIYPRIAELRLEQLKNPIYEAIGGAAMIKGIGKLTGAETLEIGDYVAKALKDSFSTYRIQEVCKAIELGARGELYKDNDMNVLSPENIFKWIHRFNEKHRIEANHKQKLHEEKMAKIEEETHRQEKIKEFEGKILTAYEGFPNSLLNLNYGVRSSYYRQLDKKGLTDISIEKKNELFKEAKTIKDLDFKTSSELFIPIQIEFTPKQIAEALALSYVFEVWKFEEFKLNDKL